MAFFCTCGGSGATKVFRDMQALCGHAPLAILTLTEAQCARGAHKAAMAACLRALDRCIADEVGSKASVPGTQ